MNLPETNRCYLVRTTPDLIEKSIVGVGWSDCDFSSKQDAEEAIKTIESSYPIGRSANQVRRFFAIQEGDIIVASLPYSVAIGRATGGLMYDKDYLKANTANQRRVDFLKDKNGEVVKLPRTAFLAAFQSRLRVRGITVNDLSEFRQQILEAYKRVEAGKDYSWSLQMDEKQEKATAAFKESLLNNIRTGRTNLRAGGVGLEHLVKELLETEGYKAGVLSKRAFPQFADADIKASREDTCATVNLLVQVKHHDGTTNPYGLEQLKKIKDHKLPEYNDHDLVFCTSASVSEEVLINAKEAGITVIDGLALVDWITQQLDYLSTETKNCLGICELPTVLGTF